MATSDRPPPLLVILQRWKSHRQLFHADWDSSVWRTDGMTSNGGGRSLVAINRAPAPQPPETLRCRRLVGVISSD